MAIEYFTSIFTGIVNKVIVAAIILLIGIVVGKVVGKVIQRVLHEIELNKIVKKAMGIKISLEEITGNIVMYVIYFAAIVIALKQIGLATLVLDIVFGGIIVIIVIAVFLSAKDFIPNMVSGIVLRQKNIIKEGDNIKTKTAEGKVIEINLVETKIQTDSGDIIHIPNSNLTREEVVVKHSQAS